jgi:hypothetical protein
MHSDYTGLDDDAELSRFREHEADDLDVTLDRESPSPVIDGLTAWPALVSAVLMVAAAAVVVIVWGY